MSTTEPTPTSEMTATGRMPNLEAQLITQAIQDPAFRQRLLNNPKAVLVEQGLNVPDNVQINVMQESSTHYYLVLPALETPDAATTELSEAELEAVAGGGGTLDSQNSNWTGCASGRSGCVATNGCSVAATATVMVASAVGAVGAGIVTGGVAAGLTAGLCIVGSSATGVGTQAR
ncbi:NHLP leader peptide family RiPP precursor [Nostoc sp.]|uniref:NHLP leader peptide family RiPP precursor n=1 Tax=Nostoc sp. TaxID=1180 RepID=UPI002FF7BF7C